MATRRLNLRPIHRLCLDLSHTDPDMPCPYCTPDHTLAVLVDAATRRHAELAAEDAETWGWAA